MTGFKAPIVGLCTVAPFLCLGLLGQHEFVVFIVAALGGIIMLAVTWSIEHFVVYVAMLMIGIITEIMSVHIGIWSYPTDRALGFPLWIPLIWSNGALFVVEFKEWIDARLERIRRRA